MLYFQMLRQNKIRTNIAPQLIELLRQLGADKKEIVVSNKEIADKLGVKEAWIRKLLEKLESAGIVTMKYEIENRNVVRKIRLVV